MPRWNVSSTFARKRGRISFEYFLRLDLISETIRYTTRPKDFIGEIDLTGSQTWTFYDFQVGQISQAIQNIMEVSYISIANLNAAWSDRIFGSDSPRDRPVYIWEAQFDPDDDNDSTNLVSTNLLFGGRIEGAEFDGNRIRISLIPKSPAFIVSAAASTISPRCGYDKHDPGMPDDFDNLCQATIAGACDKTRAMCAIYANLARFGGFDLMPAPGSTTTWGAAVLKPPPSFSSSFQPPNPWVRPPGGTPNVRPPITLVTGVRPDPRIVDFRGRESGPTGGGPTRGTPRPVGSR